MIAPFSLQHAPSLMEVIFPVQRLSVECFREQNVRTGRVLTPLGSYWKGRKPLILNKACVLGTLLPATGDDVGDLRLFERLMGMDPQALQARLRAALPRSRAPLAAEMVERYRRGELSYADLVREAKRPEEMGEGFWEGVWDEVNARLGTEARSFPELVEQLGLLADRLSCNIELPSEAGLRTLAPEKTKAAVLAPMRQIQVRSIQNKEELVKYRHTPKFAPAGQSTQMIVGATPDSDLHILRLTQGLYDRYQLKRVFFSAYVPVVESALLPSKETKPPLLREHRLYQADWLLRFYGFRAEELLDEQAPSFDPRLDPKCCWALRHPDFFPVEVNRADYEALLRVPGLGVVSARRILTARRAGPLRLENLPKLGVVMKRAQYFLTANGRMADGLRFTQDSLLRNLIAVEQSLLPQPEMRQLSLFDDAV